METKRDYMQALRQSERIMVLTALNKYAQSERESKRSTRRVGDIGIPDPRVRLSHGCSGKDGLRLAVARLLASDTQIFDSSQRLLSSLGACSPLPPDDSSVRLVLALPAAKNRVALLFPISAPLLRHQIMSFGIDLPVLLEHPRTKLHTRHVSEGSR